MDVARPAPGHHLGIDLGGTNAKWSIVEHDVETWRGIDRGTRPTTAGDGPDAVIDGLIELARAAQQRRPDIASVGVGIPGRYDPETGVAKFLPNFPGTWAGRPVAARISKATGLPTALINDARAFGLAELRLGAGRGARSLVGLTLGTGVGGVIAIDGRVYQGHDGAAGEFGHQTLVADGRPCTCGNVGCLEVYANANAVAQACGTASAESAVEAARAGDPTALAGLAEVGRCLGIGIANMITAVTPDRVVIGGGVAAAGDLLLDPIRAEVARRVRMTAVDAVTIVTAELGIWAGAMGAAVHGAEAAASVVAA